MESRRKVAEGWQQPALADWGSCLDWIAAQMGAVEGARPLQGLLQFGSRVGLVGVLLWQQRQHGFKSAGLPAPGGSGSRTASLLKVIADESAGRWAMVRELFMFRQMIWRVMSSTRGYMTLLRRRDRAGA